MSFVKQGKVGFSTTYKNKTNDQDVNNYLSNISSLGGSLTSGEIQSVCNLVESLKINGIWENLYYIAPICGRDFRTATIPLKNVDLPVSLMSSVNMIDQDYSRQYGFTGNGSNKRITVNFNPSRFIGNSNVMIGVYTSQLAGSNSGAHQYADSGDASNFWIFTRQGGSSWASNNMKISGSGNLTSSIGTPPYNGLSVIQTNSGRVQTFFNGLTNVDNTLASPSSVSSLNLLTYSTIQYYSANSVSFFFVGLALNSASHSVLFGIIDEFVYSIGRKYDILVNRDYKGCLICGQSLALSQNGSNGIEYGKRSTSSRTFTGGGLNTSGLNSFLPVGSNVTYAVMAAKLDSINSNPLIIHGFPQSGSPYASLQKGTTPYNNSILQTQSAFNLTSANNTGLVYEYQLVTHGENDDSNNNLNYGSNIQTWRSDYNSDIQSITGQSSDIIAIHSQMNTWTSYSARSTPVTAPQVYSVCKSLPSLFKMSCAKYFLTYSDNVHLNTNGYKLLGQYYAKTINSIVTTGDWEPLWPISVTRSGTQITVVFNKQDLVIDTTLVSDASGSYASRKFGTAPTSPTDTTVVDIYGFEYVDDGAPGPTPTADLTGVPAITTTNLTNDTLVFNLTTTPTGTNPRLRYAYTMTAGNSPGPVTGPRGNLRDSDVSFTSIYGDNLYNWCVTFDEAVL